MSVLPSRRAVIVATFALVVAACTSTSEEAQPSVPEVLPTLPPSTSVPEPEPQLPETTVPDDGYLWSVGDCVDLGTNAATELPYAPYGTGLLSDCADSHTHEVYFTAILSGAQDAPFPDDLTERLFDVCYVEFAELMGFSVSDSTLDVVLYLPDAEEWDAGERYHACVVYQRGTDVTYQPLSGSTADDPGSYRWQTTTGSCYDVVDSQLLPVSDPVACSEEHRFEMIGEVTPAPDDAGYPGGGAIDRDAVEACDALLAEYAVQPLEELPVLTFVVPLEFSEGEWDTGKRTVRCFAFAATPDQGLLIVAGSLGGGTFEIVGVDVDEGIQA